jgi:hypothetical protein
MEAQACRLSALRFAVGSRRGRPQRTALLAERPRLSVQPREERAGTKQLGVERLRNQRDGSAINRTVAPTQDKGKPMNSVTHSTESKTWRPDEGDVNPLIGTLIDVSGATNEWGTYPLVTLLDDRGCSWSFHAFREVAKQELTELAPEIGDPISVHWLGVPAGKEYHVYKIRFADGRGKKVDWRRFGGTESGAPDLRVPDPAQASVKEVESAAISQAEEQAERDARDAQLSDVPF